MVLHHGTIIYTITTVVLNHEKLGGRYWPYYIT